jgi:CheY-like chemotaxis protein
MRLMKNINSVLVVDDNRINRQLAKAFLERDGWQVEEAENGQAALDKLGNNNFDALLLDISMPGKSGVEILQALSLNESRKGLYVVAYTAHALEEEKRCILDAGFDAILVKPISKATLTTVFEKFRQTDV